MTGVESAVPQLARWWQRRRDLRTRRQLLTVLWSLTAGAHTGVSARDITRVTGLDTTTALLALDALETSGYVDAEQIPTWQVGGHASTEQARAGVGAQPWMRYQITDSGRSYAAALFRMMLRSSPRRGAR